MRHRSIDMRLLAGLLLAQGCLPGPSADTTRYYVLTTDRPPTSRPSPSRSPASQEQPSLGLGPVELPAYLDRSELVSRPSPNRLQLAESDRWGEPLVDGFRRTLRRDLEELLGIEGIVAHPFDMRSPPQLILAIDVMHFEPVGGAGARHAELVARWSLRTGRERHVLASDQTRVQEPISGQGGRSDEVAALSRALHRFARALASEIAQSYTDRRYDLTSQEAP